MTFPFPRFKRQFSPVRATYQSSNVNADAASSYSFTGMTLGPAHSYRWIAVAITWYNGNAVSSVTVAGVSATPLSDPGSRATSTMGASWWIAQVPTGISGTVAVTFTGSVARCGIGVFSIIDPRSPMLYDAQTFSGTTNSFSTPVTVPSGRNVLAVATMANSAAAGTYTWTGATEQYDAVLSGGITHSGALLSASNTTTLTISAQYSQTPNLAGMLNVIVL